MKFFDANLLCIRSAWSALPLIVSPMKQYCSCGPYCNGYLMTFCRLWDVVHTGLISLKISAHLQRLYEENFEATFSSSMICPVRQGVILITFLGIAGQVTSCWQFRHALTRWDTIDRCCHIAIIHVLHVFWSYYACLLFDCYSLSVVVLGFNFNLFWWCIFSSLVSNSLIRSVY